MGQKDLTFDGKQDGKAKHISISWEPLDYQGETQEDTSDISTAYEEEVSSVETYAISMEQDVPVGREESRVGICSRCSIAPLCIISTSLRMSTIDHQNQLVNYHPLLLISEEASLKFTLVQGNFDRLPSPLLTTEQTGIFCFLKLLSKATGIIKLKPEGNNSIDLCSQYVVWVALERFRRKADERLVEYMRRFKLLKQIDGGGFFKDYGLIDVFPTR